MAMLGQRKPFNPNAFVPPVNNSPLPVSIPTSPMAPPSTLADTNAPMPQVKGPPNHNWLGILADALSGLSGNGPIYAPMMERRRAEQTAFERGEEQWKSHHAAELSDQLRLLEEKRAHPDDELSRRLDQAGITDPAQRAEYARKLLDKSTTDDPLVTLTLPNKQLYSGPRSGLATALGGVAPQAHPDAVPTVEDGYSYAPGPGGRANPANWKPAGGPTQPASGGFR